MWGFLELLGRFLNIKIIGSITLGTALALVFLITGGGLLITSGREIIRVVIGGLLVGVALGFFWFTLLVRTRR
jgi:hypothetical protein